MKKISLCKRMLFALMAVVAFSSSNIFMSCASIHELSRDERLQFDSASQYRTGVPNKGGKLNEKDAFNMIINNMAIDGIEKARSENYQAGNGSKTVSLLEMKGGMNVLFHNPNTSTDATASLTLIKVDNGVSMDITLLNSSARRIELAPGSYRAIYTFSSPKKTKKWEEMEKGTKTPKEIFIGLTTTAPYTIRAGTTLISKKDGEYVSEVLQQDLTEDFQFVFESWK